MIAEEVQKQGGIITAEDLAGYKVQVRKPVVGTYRGYTILSVPPASSGGTHMIELLNILENFDLKATGYGSAATAHLWSESMKLIFADRSKYMADTAFVKVPLLQGVRQGTGGQDRPRQVPGSRYGRGSLQVRIRLHHQPLGHGQDGQHGGHHQVHQLLLRLRRGDSRHGLHHERPYG
jgi:gamma-glutamyltranspeptidase